ncbi:MAG: adenosylcobinamide-GDP ribazoletransferase [Planctomycetota bacterium]|jgi:adenosylcobinamide-GDP ribazoletransferase|nr:adenosylcobinamide-GDP ribazoletransferase [Planctomycetota bacterium]
MIRGFTTAVRLLTMVPIPGREAERLADALYWFPVVGLLLGAVLWLIAGLFAVLTPDWAMGPAGIVVAAGAVLTLFLHLDGLADWADGFLCGKDRERTLAIMKDPHLGAFGVVVLILALLMKWISVTRLIECGASHWVVIACVISRAMQVDLAVALPYARAQGGKVGPFIEDAHGRHRMVALGGALCLTSLLGGPAGVLALVAAWLVARILARWFLRRVGGVTGDLLGAASELIETGVLFAGAALGNRLGDWLRWG